MDNHSSLPGDCQRYVASVATTHAAYPSHSTGVRHHNYGSTRPGPRHLYRPRACVVVCRRHGDSPRRNQTWNVSSRAPLNSMLDITSRIASVTDVTNSWGILLVGLVLCCEDEGIRQITEALNIGDEVLAVTSDGVD